MGKKYVKMEDVNNDTALITYLTHYGYEGWDCINVGKG